MSQYNFTLKANEISLMNDRHFDNVLSNHLMNKTQISNMISEQIYNIIHDSPDVVDTMIEISTFFETTDMELLSTIEHEYTNIRNNFIEQRLPNSSSISTNQSIIAEHLYHISNDVSTELTRAISQNMYESFELSVNIYNTNSEDVQMSNEQSTVYHVNLSQHLRISSEIKNTLNVNSDVITNYSNELITLLSTIDNQNDAQNSEITYENDRASLFEQKEIVSLSGIESKQFDMYTNQSNNFSRSNYELSSSGFVLSSELSNNIYTNSSQTQFNLKNVDEHRISLSVNHYNIDYKRKYHEQHITLSHDNLSTLLSTNFNNTYEHSNNISTEFSTSYNQDHDNYNQLSIEFSVNEFKNRSDILTRVNVSGDSVHGNLHINNMLVLGPYWRIREDDDHLGVNFETYDTVSNEWIVTIPFRIDPINLN